MATVTGFTAARMLEIENSCIVDGAVDLQGVLTFTRRDGGEIHAGNVRGLGVQPGGTSGSAFFKKSGADYDTEWRKIDASDVAAGVFAPGRMAHVRSDASSRAWFTTDPMGGWGGAHTTLAMSPPTDGTWTNALDLRVDNVTKFAVNKDGILTSGSIPAGFVNSGRLGVGQVPLLSYVPDTGRSYLSTAESGTITGGTMSYLGISPPGDGSGLFWLATSGATKWSIDKTGELTLGTVPFSRVSGDVPFSRVSGDVPFARMADPTNLESSGTNLNNYATTGLWHQGGNAGASAGANYPAPHAGLLEVTQPQGTSMVYQRYTTYKDHNKVYTRGRYSGAWSAWKELSTSITAAGTVAISAAANAVRSATVAFPSGRFNSGDTIAVATGVHTTVPQNRSVGIANASSTGVTIHLWAHESISITVSWIASRVG